MNKIAWVLAMVAAATTAIVAVLVTDRPQPAQAPPPARQSDRRGFAPAMEKPNIRQLKAGYHLMERAGVPGAPSPWSDDEGTSSMSFGAAALAQGEDVPQ